MADFAPQPPDGSTGGDGHTVSTEVPEHFSEYKYTHGIPDTSTTTYRRNVQQQGYYTHQKESNLKVIVYLSRTLCIYVET